MLGPWASMLRDNPVVAQRPQRQCRFHVLGPFFAPTWSWSCCHSFRRLSRLEPDGSSSFPFRLTTTKPFYHFREPIGALSSVTATTETHVILRQSLSF